MSQSESPGTVSEKDELGDDTGYHRKCCGERCGEDEKADSVASEAKTVVNGERGIQPTRAIWQSVLDLLVQRESEGGWPKVKATRLTFRFGLLS